MYRALFALLVTVAAVSTMPATCRKIQELQDAIPAKYQHLLSNHQLEFYKTLSCEEIDTLCRVFAEGTTFEEGIAQLRDSHPALLKKVLEQVVRQEQLGEEVQEHIDEVNANFDQMKEELARGERTTMNKLNARFAHLPEDIRKRIIKAFPVFAEENALEILIEMNSK